MSDIDDDGYYLRRPETRRQTADRLLEGLRMDGPVPVSGEAEYRQRSKAEAIAKHDAFWGIVPDDLDGLRDRLNIPNIPKL